MEDWDEYDDNEDEASEDQLAMEAFDAFMEVEGDDEVAQASREALAAITESALALKANREARERRVALEHAAERKRHEALARQKKELARQDARERTKRSAEAERQERARLAQEARRLARERERLQLEREQFELRRQGEEARQAERRRRRAVAEQRKPVANQPPVAAREKTGRRRKAGARRSGAMARRAAPPATPVALPSKVAKAHPPRSPRNPPTPRPDLQRVASDFKDAGATATADLLMRRSQPEPPRSRSGRPDNHAALTGADLANWRSRHGLTQSAAARRLGVGQGTISKAESKGATPLGPALLRALAPVLEQEQRTA